MAQVDFDKISKNYTEIYFPFLSKVFGYLRRHYYPRCANKTVLDVGNGGIPPTMIFGGIPLKRFVGLDNNQAMLQRGTGYEKKYSHQIGCEKAGGCPRQAP